MCPVKLLGNDRVLIFWQRPCLHMQFNLLGPFQCDRSAFAAYLQHFPKSESCRKMSNAYSIASTGRASFGPGSCSFQPGNCFVLLHVRYAVQAFQSRTVGSLLVAASSGTRYTRVFDFEGAKVSSVVSMMILLKLPINMVIRLAFRLSFALAPGSLGPLDGRGTRSSVKLLAVTSESTSLFQWRQSVRAVAGALRRIMGEQLSSPRRMHAATLT